MMAVMSGAVVGLVAVVDKPGSPFLAVAGQAGAVSFAVNMLAATYPMEQRAAAVGAGMGVLCHFVHELKGKTSLQYAIMTGVVAYGTSLFMEPLKETPEDKKVKPLKQA